MVAGSTVWMAASARPAWAVRAPRAAAHSSSRRTLRGIVSPSRRSTTSQLAPSSSPSPTATTAGTGTPAAAAARAAGPPPSAHGPCGAPPLRSICRMSGRAAPSGVSSSNALVTREAPPERRRSPRTVPPSRRPSAADTSSLLSRGAIPTRRGRQASRRRRAGAGTPRCRSRSVARRSGPRRSSAPAPR